MSGRSIPLAKSYTYEKLCVKKKKATNCTKEVYCTETPKKTSLYLKIKTFTTCEDVLAHDHNNKLSSNSQYFLCIFFKAVNNFNSFHKQ